MIIKEESLQRLPENFRQLQPRLCRINQKDNMTKNEIIGLAFSNYPGRDDTAGDALALFIDRELSDTYEPNRPDAIQLSIAAHALQRGVEDLQAALKPVYKRLTAKTAMRLAA